jgi:uncharacterized protein involved in exopolysaccharide biosynthesis
MWFVILFAGIAGGLIGLFLGRVQPPRYEAAAAVRIAIDYSRTHPLDESAERQALNRVLDLILSDETLGRAVQQAPQSAKTDAGINSAADLKEAIRLRDLRGRWELIATANAPQTASDLANAWADSTIENAESALEHSWRASELQNQIFGLGCELMESTEGSAGTLWVCRRGSDEERREELAASLLKEAELSHGLIPALSVSHLESAVPPSRPASQTDAIYGLIGAVGGLVAGTLIVALRDPLAKPEPRVG